MTTSIRMPLGARYDKRQQGSAHGAVCLDGEPASETVAMLGPASEAKNSPSVADAVLGEGVAELLLGWKPAGRTYGRGDSYLA